MGHAVRIFNTANTNDCCQVLLNAEADWMNLFTIVPRSTSKYSLRNRHSARTTINFTQGKYRGRVGPESSSSNRSKRDTQYKARSGRCRPVHTLNINHIQRDRPHIIFNVLDI